MKSLVFLYKLKVLVNLYRIIKIKKKKSGFDGSSYVAVLPLEGDGYIIAYEPGSEFLTLIVPPEFIQDNRRAKMLEKSAARQRLELRKPIVIFPYVNLLRKLEYTR